MHIQTCIRILCHTQSDLQPAFYFYFCPFLPGSELLCPATHLHLVGEMGSSVWKGEQGPQDIKLIVTDSYQVHLPVKGLIQL